MTEDGDNLEDKIDELGELLDREEELMEQIQTRRSQRQSRLTEFLSETGMVDDDIDRELVEAFAEQPYKVLPKDENEAYVVVPRFVPFNVGWLHEQDEAYNTFIVNKFVDWIDSLPEEIREQVGISKQFDGEVTVSDGVVDFPSEEARESAWSQDEYRDNFYQRRGDTMVKLNRGAEFDVIAQLVDDGHLPFEPAPVSDDDLTSPPESISLRDYQQRAWERFTETGMIGVYWPPGAGKTFLSLYCGERLRGDKLVVVPSNTLKEQWRERIEEFCAQPSEWSVQTYQYLTRYGNIDEYERNGPTLTIFDEVHHLPSNTFSKLATIDTTYRIGLSASPYREDGRTEYIFALTGFPVGLEWQELIRIGVVDQPDVTVNLYRTQRQKRSDVTNLLNERTGKILIFCDSIDEGKHLSDKIGVPFIHGETRNRMDKFRENRIVIASRVADEGVSLEGLDHVIEYDFHAGSRRQEAQRVGRVMHGESEGEHLIMMTDSELQEYEKRLYALEEQGINIRFNRRV